MCPRFGGTGRGGDGFLKGFKAGVLGGGSCSPCVSPAKNSSGSKISPSPTIALALVPHS